MCAHILASGICILNTNLKHPLQVLVIIRINSFYIMISYFNTQDVHVKRASEMNIQQLTIK